MTGKTRRSGNFESVAKSSDGLWIALLLSIEDTQLIVRLRTPGLGTLLGQFLDRLKVKLFRFRVIFGQTTDDAFCCSVKIASALVATSLASWERSAFT